jgi:Zn-dependent protease
MRCEKCGVDDPFPFVCSYCGKPFCADHRLPESHDCSDLWMARPPSQVSPPPRQGRKFFDHTDRVNSPRRVYWFSRTELEHLGLGTLLVTLVALSFTGSFLPNQITLSLALIFAASFLLHEMAHKFVAQRNRLWSEFRLTMFGALLTLISIFSPFKIIAPGAVMISGRADVSMIGKTSFAGPLTNVLLGFGFWILSFYTQSPFASVFRWGAEVNGILAIFNLIPFGVLDGRKIMSWNFKVWAIGLALSATLLIVNNFLSSP